MTARELRPKNSSKTIVAIFLAATAALVPPFARNLWLADSTENFLYGLFASVLYALALVLVLLIFLPIHFRSRDRFVVRWWMYAGIGTIYALILQIAVSLFTGGTLRWSEYPLLLASGGCVGWTFWFILEVEKKWIGLAFGLCAAFLWWPIFTFLGPITLRPMQVWLGTEVVSQTELPSRAAFQVTRIPTGMPLGINHSYLLAYRDSPGDSFETLYGWARPPEGSDFEVTQIGGLLSVITPRKDVLLVHKTYGWHPFLLQEIISKRIPNQPGLFALERQDPLVKIIEINSDSRIVRVEIKYQGVLPQNATLKLNPTGDRIDIVTVEFPEDPRLHYLKDNEFDASTNDLLTIIRDMDNDGRNEFIVSHTGARNDGGENIWRIYRQIGEEYHPISASLSISRDVVSHWTLDGGSTTGITTFFPISSTKGVIATYAITGDSIVESTLNVAPDDRRIGNVTNSAAQLRIMSTPAVELEKILCSNNRDHRRC